MAIDWTKGMTQTLECFEVDAATWRETKKLSTVKTCTVTRELDAELIESASISLDEDLGEIYIRAYLAVTQGDESKRIPIATFLAQTPSTDFDGMVQKQTVDGYSPLIELRDDMPPIGYTIPSGSNCVSAVESIVSKACRAPVSMLSDSTTLTEDYVAQEDDTWLTLCKDVLSKANMRFIVSPLGVIGCEPIRDPASLSASFTFEDDEYSIISEDITSSSDWYGLPNVYEAIYSKDTGCLRAEAVNDDPNSPLSTVSRGRRVLERDTNPELPEEPTQEDINVYAKRKLREISAREHRLVFSHGWTENKIGQGIRFIYSAAGIDQTMQTIKQTITLETGVTIQEEATWSEVMFT